MGYTIVITTISRRFYGDCPLAFSSAAFVSGGEPPPQQQEALVHMHAGCVHLGVGVLAQQDDGV